jgi:hypothetical protein
MYYPYREQDDSPLLTALVLSVMLHAVLLSTVALQRQSENKPQERLIEVSLRPAPPEDIKQQIPASLVKEQIITPPDLPESAIAPVTRFKSDKNFTAAKEQVRRGDGATPKSAPQQTKQAPPAFQTGSSRSLAGIKLKLSDNALQELAKNPVQQRDGLRNLTEYRPFAPNETEQLFRVRPGSPDYLPGIPDGEITMLNAKADRFAPFVRRVAEQVFGLVRKFQWHTLPAQEVRRIEEFTSVEAVMSPAGKLIEVNLLEPSGSASFDRLIARSVREGANDQNPPAGAAAEDGNIRFIFRSRCWSRPGAGGAGESRWLLLATGLR